MLATASKRSSAQVAVVHHPELDSVADPSLARPLPGQLGLRLRQRDPETEAPCSRAAWIARLPQPQPMSSIRMPGLELELAADQLELGALGVLQRLDVPPRTARSCRSSSRRGTGRRTRSRRRSGVGRPRRRGSSCVAVARAGCSSAAGGLAGGDGARLPAAPPQPNRSRRRSPSGGAMPAAEQRDDPVEVVDVDLAAHVGAPEPELAGRAQNVSDRPRRPDRERRAVAGRRNARSVPELDRERTISKCALNCATQPVGARRRHGASLTQKH